MEAYSKKRSILDKLIQHEKNYSKAPFVSDKIQLPLEKPVKVQVLMPVWIENELIVKINDYDNKYYKQKAKVTSI